MKIFKLITAITITSMIFIGCGSNDNLNKIDNVKVIDKEKVGQGRISSNYITVEKNGEKLKLEIYDDRTFTSIQEGTTVNVEYYITGKVNKITFPTFNNQ